MTKNVTVGEVIETLGRIEYLALREKSLKKSQKKNFITLKFFENKAAEYANRRIERRKIDREDALMVSYASHIGSQRWGPQIRFFECRLKITNEKLGAIRLERAILLGKYDIKNLIP